MEVLDFTLCSLFLFFLLPNNKCELCNKVWRFFEDHFAEEMLRIVSGFDAHDQVLNRGTRRGFYHFRQANPIWPGS